MPFSPLLHLPPNLWMRPNGGRRIQKIVQSLRAFSYLQESGKKWVSVRSQLENSLDLLQSRFNPAPGSPDGGSDGFGQRSAIELQTHWQQTPPLYCEGNCLSQVWMHLLTNALDAIEEAQDLQAHQQSTSAQGDLPMIPPVSGDPFRISVSLSYDPDLSLTVCIEDNGIGMTKATRQHLFDPFFTTKPVGKGTGLGLSVSYGTVTQLGGSIAVESTPGEGSLITVTLPLSPGWENVFSPEEQASLGG